MADAEYEHVIQQNFGYGHGWEDVCGAEDEKDAARLLREYIESQPQYLARRIYRKVQS